MMYNEEIINEINYGTDYFNNLQYIQWFNEIVKEYKNGHKTMQYNNIIILKNLHDANYRNYIVDIDMYYKELDEENKGKLIMGKFMPKEFFNRDIIILFMDNIIKSADMYIKSYYEYYKIKLRNDYAYKKFILSTLMHEHMHWYQVLWFRNMGGSDLVKFIYDKEKDMDYNKMIKEKEASIYEKLSVIDEFENLDIDNKMKKAYRDIELNYVFAIDYKDYITEFIEFGYDLSDDSDIDDIDFHKFKFDKNGDVKIDMKKLKLYNYLKNLIKNSKVDPKIRSEFIKKNFENNFTEIMVSHTKAEIESQNNFLEWLKTKRMTPEAEKRYSEST